MAAALVGSVGHADDDAGKAEFRWLQNARTFILDGYAYPLAPRIELDAEKLAEAMSDMHANTLRVATSGNYWFIPNTPFAVASNLGGRDVLAECISACKPRGIRIVAYVRTGGGVAAEIVKPEWAYRDRPDGHIRTWWDLGVRRAAFCWNTGYRDAFFQLIETITTRYDVDGIYFDAWKIFYRFLQPKVCYCDGCAKGFKQATGLALPYRPNARDYTLAERNVIRRYHDWYLEELLEIFRETKRRIRKHKNIPLIFNLNHARFIRDRSFTHPRIVEESDAFLYEMSHNMLDRVEGISLAVSHGLTVWPYADAYHGYARIPVYGQGVAQHVYTSIAFGGAPTLYHTYVYVDHPEARGPVREAFGTFARNASLVAGFRPEPYCAVVWNHRDPPGHARKSGLWKHDARLSTSGALAALLDGHIQVTSLLAEELAHPESLKRYKVLYLADIGSLTETQVAGIRTFVANGGGLVMSYATSLFDEQGDRQPDFALGTLARVKLVKTTDPVRNKMAATLAMGSGWDLYLKARPDCSIFQHLPHNRLMPSALYQPVATLPGATVAADLIRGGDSAPLFPGIVVSRHGKGKVIYLATALESMYRQSRIRAIGNVLRDVVTYSASAPPPYDLDAPATLISNMMSRGDTRVLHLVNWTGCKFETSGQNAEYIPSVDNVTIRFRVPDGQRVTGVRLLAPAEVSHLVEDGTLLIQLPKVDKYQGVVISLQSATDNSTSKEPEGPQPPVEHLP